MLRSSDHHYTSDAGAVKCVSTGIVPILGIAATLFFDCSSSILTVAGAGSLASPGALPPGLFFLMTLVNRGEHMLQYPSNETPRMVCCSGEVVPTC